jgi:tRNA 2-selenouridine synthase
MAVESIDIARFLELSKTCLVLDVRSPGEYDHAHFPQAFNLPLFSDAERKVVGTAYKQQSREQAIKIGLGYFGAKMLPMVEMTEQLIGQMPQGGGPSPNKTVLLHCWRGGMRSAGVAWLLDLYGFKVYTLRGGYKAFRRWVLWQFDRSYSFNVVAGFTGSGKTALLQALESRGEKIIDLEALASHKGSAFGGLGETPQPSQEMFENKLALALHQHASPGQLLWIEDESQRIGDLNIPAGIYGQMKRALVYFLDIPFDHRLVYILTQYGKHDKEKLLACILRIKKRLGPLETKNAINGLLEDDLTHCFSVLLAYYDRWYAKSLVWHREEGCAGIIKIPCAEIEAHKNASLVQKMRLKQVAE